MATRVGKSFSYNADCDVCGFTFKNKDLKLRWDGFMVCKDDWETRNLADFYDTPNDTHILPWTRPAPKLYVNEYQFRRNFWNQTEDFTATSSWAATATVMSAATAILNPSGISQACSKFAEDGTNGGHFISAVAFTTVLRTSAVYTTSVYVKPNGRTWIVMQQQDLAGGLATAWFNLSGAGTLGSRTGSCLWSNISPESNGWYRISISYNNNVGANANTCSLYGSTSNGTNTYQGDGSSGYYFWGFQQENSLQPAAIGTVSTTVQPSFVVMRPSAYQPILDTSTSPTLYPTPPTLVNTWVPTWAGGTTIFCAGLVKVNTNYIIQNNVLSFIAEFQNEPGGYLRNNNMTMSLPVQAVRAGNFNVSSGSGDTLFVNTIAAGALTTTSFLTTTTYALSHVQQPESLVIAGSYGV